MPLRRPVVLLLTGALVGLACAGGDGDGAAGPTSAPTDAASDPTPEGDGNDERAAPAPRAPDVTVEGPVAGTPQTSSTAGMEEAGYVEEEYFVTGSAAAFDPVGALTDDGRWTLEPRDDRAPFTTRILVKRPTRPDHASGVVLVEWNNVSAGFDSTPDWSYTSTEIMRAGHVHIGVSAQEAGVDAEDGGGLAGGFGSSLVESDPERYGTLSHPGDDHSYDIFSLIGALARVAPTIGPDPLAELPRRHVIAIGESQSAFRLTSYINGVHSLAAVYDGFLVHSRGGGAAPITSEGDDGLTSAIDGAIRIREDLGEPVLIFSTESDLTQLRYAAARQADSEWIRSWEIAGTAHADAFLLGGDPVGAAEALGCAAPVNDGPQHLALKAAVSRLVTWVADGTAPPEGAPIELTADGAIARDGDGNARGGVRLPPVEVPAATYSGDPSGDEVLCGLFGSTAPFPPDVLQARYGTREAYLGQVTEALDDAVDRGFVLAADRAVALEEAAEFDFG